MDGTTSGLMADRPGFLVTVHSGRNGDIEVGSDDVRGMVALILRRQRALSGLSLAEAAKRLGAKSRNACARYERGDSSPTLEKLSALMAAVSPSEDFGLQRTASVGGSATARGRRPSGADTSR